jgi:hypothetical protein
MLFAAIHSQLLMLWTAPPPARECHGCGAAKAPTIRRSYLCTRLRQSVSTSPSQCFRCTAVRRQAARNETPKYPSQRQDSEWLPVRQFPHTDTRGLSAKCRHIAAFRARPYSVCVRDGLSAWAYRTRTGESVRALLDWICVTTSPEVGASSAAEAAHCAGAAAVDSPNKGKCAASLHSPV